MRLRVRQIGTGFAQVELEDGRHFDVPRAWVAHGIHQGDTVRAFGDGDHGLRLLAERAVASQTQVRTLPSDTLDRLQQLAVLTDAFDLQTARAVLGAPQTPAEELHAWLQALESRHFLRATAHDRYLIAPPVRASLLKLPLASPQPERVEGARSRLLTHLLTLTETCNAHPNETLQRLEAHAAHVQATLQWAFSNHTHAERGARLAVALDALWWQRGGVEEGQHWLNRALESVSSLAPQTQRLVWRGAGIFAQNPSDLTLERTRLAHALERSRAAGDAHGEADALGAYGQTLIRGGEYAQAELYLQRERGLVLTQGDPRRVAANLGALGAVAFRSGDLERAEARLSASLTLQRASGDATGSACTLTHLGMLRVHTGRLDNAQTVLLQALEQRRKSGDRAGSAATLHALGVVASVRGEPKRAASLLIEALRVSLVSGDVAQIADDLEALARVAVLGGRFAHSARLHGAAESLRTRAHTPRARVFQNQYAEHVPSKLEQTLDGETLATLGGLGAMMDGGALLALARTLLDPESGQNALGQTLDKGAAKRPSPPLSAQPNTEEDVPELTTGELEVLRLVARGYANKRVAKALGLSEHSVKAHLTGIFDKFGVNSRAAAVAVAAALKLLR
jgi:ATP/maltotriose-dependent transcriptional regulator MalT